MGALAQPGDFKGTAAKPKILSAEAPTFSGIEGKKGEVVVGLRAAGRLGGGLGT